MKGGGSKGGVEEAVGARSPPPPTSRADVMSNPSKRLSAAWRSGRTWRSPQRRRCQMCTRKEGAASTGDGPGLCGGFLQSARPPWSQPQEHGALWPAWGCAHRSCLGARARQATLRGPRGHGQGSWSRSAALLPPPVSLVLLSQVLGVGGRKTSVESRSFISFSSFRARRWRPLRGDPLAEGWTDGCAEGRGKHHWPSESGIETDGRGEQYYHSKDPMGAIQQIPY